MACLAFLSACRHEQSGSNSRRGSAPGNPRAASDSIDPLSIDTVAFEVRQPPILGQCGYHNGRDAQMNAILEIVGGGAACIDIDRDGYVDLFFPRGGTLDPLAQSVKGVNGCLLRGLGDWQWSDATSGSRIDSSSIFSHGIMAADLNEDGMCDLVIYGFNGAQWWFNQGDGTFTQHPELQHAAWTTAAAALDIDGDRCLDLYLGSYVDWSFAKHQVCKSQSGQSDVCSPNAFGGMRNQVLINCGDGSFRQEDNALVAGQPSKTLGIVAAQFEAGQGTGVYVANDLIANFLFTRGEDGHFQEHAVAAGAAVDDEGVANGSMGVAVLDFNNDLLADLFVTNFEHEKMALYLNQNHSTFHHASRRSGLNRNDLRLVGFGVVAADFDGDADEDVLLSAGHVHYHPDAGSMEQLPAYLENDSGKAFVKRTPNCTFFSRPVVGRGLATGDLDGDGDLDVVATELFGPPSLLENKTQTQSDWVSLELVGTQCSRTPIGATVHFQVGQQHRMRQVVSGGSYLSHSQNVLHFSWPRQVGAECTVTVYWPDGTNSQPQLVPTNTHTLIVQR